MSSLLGPHGWPMRGGPKPIIGLNGKPLVRAPRLTTMPRPSPSGGFEASPLAKARGCTP